MRFIASLVAILTAATFGAPSAAVAQDQGGQAYRSLSFPETAVERADDLRAGTAFGKPAGTGPFAAVILLQTCDGGTSDQRDWGRRAMAHGYVALVVDSMGPRGVTSENCNLPPPVRVRDALQARRHLERFDFVDKDRIAAIGFSAGANAVRMIGNAAASSDPSNGFPPFPALVSFYPACVARGPGNTLNPVYDGTVRTSPELILFGDRDPQADVSECVPQFERLKSGGSDIEWTIYRGATHCFDCKTSSGKQARDTFHNKSMPFLYNSDATADAERRVFAFLAAKMGVGPK